MLMSLHSLVFVTFNVSGIAEREVAVCGRQFGPIVSFRHGGHNFR